MARKKSQREPEQHNSIAYEGTMAMLALVSVGLGIYDIFHTREEPGMIWRDWLDLSIVAVFILDFIREARRRGSFRAYAREHWWEIPTLIPITSGIAMQLEGFPLIRALRLVRFVRFLRLLRLAGLAGRVRSGRHVLARVMVRARVAMLLFIGAAGVGFGAIGGFLAERHANEHMTRFIDALWWALNMFTNVAYVDFQPVTSGGRVVAGILEFTGIAFIGVFAASITNALLREPDPMKDAH